MQPDSSVVSNVPSPVEPPDWIVTGCPSPAARSSQSRRISPKPPPLSQRPRNSAQESDSVANNSSAPILTPGDDVGADAAHPRQAVIGHGLRLQQDAGELLSPGHDVVGPFQRILHMVRSR